MYSYSNLTKIIVFAVLIAAALFGANKYMEAKRREVGLIVEAIGEVAAVITESGGQDPERIAAAVKKVEGSSMGNIEKAIDEIAEGPAEYIAVELLLRRIFELNRTAITRSGIERFDRAPETYPWTITGRTAEIEQFEVITEQPGRVSFLFQSFDSQGHPRRPWH